MAEIITVGISDLNIARSPDILATYALGSCVGIALKDVKTGIGGLAHIMLPWSKEANTATAINPKRYADTGIRSLLALMKQNGASTAITAKIAGGAQMFQTTFHSFNIGQRNVDAVKTVLGELRIPIQAEDTGANYGRTVFFHVDTGVLEVKTASKTAKVL